MPNPSEHVTVRDLDRVENDVSHIKNNMLPDIYEKVRTVERQNFISLGVGAFHVAIVIFLLNKVFDLQLELNNSQKKTAVAELFGSK